MFKVYNKWFSKTKKMSQSLVIAYMVVTETAVISLSFRSW